MPSPHASSEYASEFTGHGLQMRMPDGEPFIYPIAEMQRKFHDRIW